MGWKDKGFGARGELAQRSPVGVLVEALHVLEGSAVHGKELRMALCGKGVDHGPELLVWQVLQVKGEVGRTSNGVVGPDAPTMLS